MRKKRWNIQFKKCWWPCQNSFQYFLILKQTPNSAKVIMHPLKKNTFFHSQNKYKTNIMLKARAPWSNRPIFRSSCFYPLIFFLRLSCFLDFSFSLFFVSLVRTFMFVAVCACVGPQQCKTWSKTSSNSNFLVLSRFLTVGQFSCDQVGGKSRSTSNFLMKQQFLSAVS